MKNKKDIVLPILGETIECIVSGHIRWGEVYFIEWDESTDYYRLGIRLDDRAVEIGHQDMLSYIKGKIQITVDHMVKI